MRYNLQQSDFDQAGFTDPITALIWLWLAGAGDKGLGRPALRRKFRHVKHWRHLPISTVQTSLDTLHAAGSARFGVIRPHGRPVLIWFATSVRLF
jgi:hypothetical protein